jgi:hypothetical protein
LVTSFQNPKQSQIENLEDLCGMRCESNDLHTGSWEKFEDRRGKVNNSPSITRCLLCGKSAWYG